ncbi:hypothetical protein LG634_16550 [Streptomyces bambusae]|uniref:hypothetical protein n=1 Tax=Streptomyces bambusae TaxID=1550616 RepID=UPI001CFD7A93|nr:hypothetical protein [Streptomyces bambusae]MCB5166442.1 hypothetical protein [Streptomyces bambusae]
MLWPMIAIVLGFLGLVVLAVPAVRVFVEVRRLSLQVAESSRRISSAAGELEDAATGLAASGEMIRTAGTQS